MAEAVAAGADVTLVIDNAGIASSQNVKRGLSLDPGIYLDVVQRPA